MAPPWTRYLGLGLNVCASHDAPQKYVLRIESANDKHRFQGDLGKSLDFKVALIHEVDRYGIAHLHQEEGSHFWHVRKEQIEPYVLKAVADKAARAAHAQQATATAAGAAAASAPPPTPTQTTQAGHLLLFDVKAGTRSRLVGRLEQSTKAAGEKRKTPEPADV
jgi:biotin carboxyl carrier protein